MKNIILLPVLLFTIASYAQVKLHGRISDQQNGLPLEGATIKIKESGKIISSNVNGEFEIIADNSSLTMIISHIGYETREISIKERREFINVTMTATATSLGSVTVTGYENNRRLMETSGSVGVLRSKELQRGDNMDIMPALNTIPGVKMEAYVTGDYRISIRGSLLNNPWGIRNVKLYWNDIPLSSPDGTASHGVDFDPAMIGNIEVLKGPSGSTYGAGNGGVILFKSNKATAGQNQLETGFTGGSYGFTRFNTNYKTGNENYNIAANYTRQRYDGYRENEWSDKDVVNIFAQFFPSSKYAVNVFVNHATGTFGIAGELDSTQVEANPRQAVQFCKDNKTSVRKYNVTQFGASQTYNFTNNFFNTTSIFGSFQTLDHPYGTSNYYNGYLKESTEGYGVRSKFVFAPQLGRVKSRFTAGIEAMYQHQFGDTYSIINDVPGTSPETGDLYQSLITVSKSNIIFAQAEFDLPYKFFLTAGASYNDLSYDITDLFKAPGHVDYSGLIDFPKKISPRIGLVKLIDKNFAAHASLSYGYAPPPLWEINNFDGTLNTTIKPEDGRNLEVGLRGNMVDNRLSFDISAYQMSLTNAIVPVANQYGTTSYRNAGSTNQKGLEAMVVFTAIRNSNAPVTLLKFWLSSAFNNYEFKEYSTESFDWNSNTVIKNNYSGNKVTGVVPTSISGGVDIETKCGLYGNAVIYYYDKTPMNDANTAYNKSYSLLNGKLGFRKAVKQFGFDLFAGVNNAFDTKYSSLINFNADAYGYPAPWFNPSPGVNFYGGLTVKYNFNK